MFIGLNMIIINMIQKLGNIFPFKFWIWIPLIVVSYNDIFCILENFRVLIDC